MNYYVQFFFSKYFSGPGVLLEGVFMKKVKHIIADTGGAKVCVVG